MDIAHADLASHAKAAAAAMPLEILVCRCIAAAVIIPLFTPALHKRLRSLLRPGAVFHAERGLEWVVFAQQHQHAVVTALANWSCATVTVTFYATFLPSLVWVGIPELGWRLVFLMAGCLYIGNALKDLVSAPRPTGLKGKDGDFRPKLITSNSEAATYALEYGMPSTHTMNSLVLNGYAVYYLLQRDYLSPQSAPYLYGAALLWTLWIGVARIYMGMHTPIDIAGGLAAGVVTLGAYISVDNTLDHFILTGPHVGAVMLLACVVLLRLHPLPLIYTPSYEFSVSFAGVAFGTATGLRRAKHLHVAGALLPVLWRQAGALAVLRRLALGFFIMIFATTLAKKAMLRILPPIYRLYPRALRRLWQPPMHTLKDLGELGIPVNAKGVPWDVDVTARFFGYSMIGFPLTELIPRVFQLLQW